MPKTLTGQELQLDDGPARDSELFLVDGNNLAYRAFFALPEELATSDGFPTNALLGFANMLFKLLSDYRPKGVAVAWDSTPTHRAAVAQAADVVYKEGRRPMPDLLREQFPHFRPIVEAFGYRNLEFEGWEADDVIATLATRADEAGVKTTVVSTDRDAFQLCSPNITLMMTPRGVADVNVYTPERVELRYGIRPDQVPDFIGLKGDTSDNIPGVPGIGDKTAGQLIAQYGTLEEVIAHADELSPARRKNITEFADQARMSKELATMRRDLDLDFDPTGIVLEPPDRSQLREMFRRFEFRGLLNRIDDLEDAIPAAVPIPVAGTVVPWHEGELPQVRGRAGLAIVGDRFALAQDDGVTVGAWDESLIPRLRDAELVAHDFKSLPRLTMAPADDTLIEAYLIEPGRSEYLIEDLQREYGLEVIPEPATEEETAALITRAEAARRLAGPMRERVVERGSERLYDEIELPLTAVLSSMEDAGVKIDTYRMGEITARLADRVEELEAKAYELAGEEFMIGSTQQVARILFDVLGLTPGRKGKTGYSTDTRVLRSIRGEHEIVNVIEEWRELSKLVNTYLKPLPLLISERDGRLHTTFNQAAASTGRLSTTNPNLQAIPIRTELGREIRSAFVAEPGYRLISADYSQVELRILAHVSGEPRLREAFARNEDIHTATAAEVLGKDPAALTKDERNVAKMVNFGIIYGISAFGLSENLEIPREQAQEYIDTYLARFPHVQDFIQRTIEQAERDGYVTTLLGRRRPVPEIRVRNRQTRALGERLAVNSVMQGTAADVIKVAMIRIHNRLREEGRGARLVLQVHDELLLEAPETETSAIKDLVREEMCGAYPLDPPLAVDVGVGDDWNDAKSRLLLGAGPRPVRDTRWTWLYCATPNGERDNRKAAAGRRRRLGRRPRRRPDPRLRVDFPDDQRGRGRARHRRARRQGRGSRRHRLQVRGRHPGRRAFDPPLGQSRRRGLGRRGDRRARAHEGGRRRAPDPLEEARAVRARLEEDRGRRRVRRAGRRSRDRGRQGRPDPRPRRPRLPACLTRRHSPRAGPRRVHGDRASLQGDRAEPVPQQRRPLPSRRPRRRAQGSAPADPRPAQPGRCGRGHDLEHRRLRRVRRPERDGRPDPHLRAVVEPRQPPVGGARDRPGGQGQGARHRPRPPAHLARSQADAVGSVAAGARELLRERRRRGSRDQGRHLRRLRRDPPGSRGARAHLRARAAPRGEPARGRLAG